ncbi:MAG TPA: hypothetical protein VFB66_08135, partial [Tepidisphaeraceae bacterium]|nr:hypothetical protein [Tepidisphaeraceae bacterium]
AMFVLTTGVWSRQETRWTSPGRFKIEATRTGWGLPHWLVFTRVRSTGTAPPMNSGSLPEAGDFQPGWHVEPAALCLSLAGCLATSLLVCAAVWLLRRGHLSPARGNAIWYPLAGVTVLAGAAGWASDAASGPTEDLLAFVALPLLASVATFAVRTYPGGVLLATAATVSYWWASRMVKLRWPTNGRMDSDDLREVAVNLLVATIVAVGSAFLSRQRTAVRPAA